MIVQSVFKCPDGNLSLLYHIEQLSSLDMQQLRYLQFHSKISLQTEWDNTPVNIWIERSYRQDILLYVMGYKIDKLLFESGYYHKHSGCVSHLGEEHCIM